MDAQFSRDKEANKTSQLIIASLQRNKAAMKEQIENIKSGEK